MKVKPINLQKLKTYSIAKRRSKVRKEDFASAYRRGAGFKDFLDSLPDILAAKNLKCVVDAIIRARKLNKPVLFMAGAHVIKCGLSPILIGLMKEKILTGLALNGAGAIHDFEVAYIGRTSEEVIDGLKDGSFGMARETALFINQTVKKAARNNSGFGESLGREILKKNLPYANMSVLAGGSRLGVPVTVHVAIGTDIIHQHPSCDGAATGKTTMKDFRTFISMVSQLGGGGVVVNLGSAVILPEVFLKALSISRNLGFKVNNFTTANFDMIPAYRPLQNVVMRPTSHGGGSGYHITGHHEIMIPLLAAAILEKL